MGAMHFVEESKKKIILYWLVSGLVCLAGFLFDWFTPLGIASGLIYIVFVLSAIQFRSYKIILIFAATSTILVISAYFHIPSIPVKSQTVVLLNRGMTILVIWVVAYLSCMILRSLHTTKLGKNQAKAVIDNAVDSMILIDGKGLIQEFNPASVKLFGYEVAEVIGQNVKMLMPESYAREHDQYLHDYQTTGKAKIIGIGRQVVGKRKDSSEFPMDLSVGKVKTEGGNLFIGIVRDISERVEAEQVRDRMIAELSKSHLATENAEARSKAIIDNAVDSMILIDGKGLIQEFNPASVKLFGYEVAEVIGQNVKMLMPESYAKEHDQYLHDYQTTGKAKIIGIGRRVTGKRKDGSEFPMDLSVGKVKTGSENLFIGIVRDITHLVEAEEIRDQMIMELSQSNLAAETAQARTKAVIDNAVDSMILIDRKGLIQEFNPASVILFGYQVSEVIGQNVKMLMPENYAREHDQYLHDYQTTGKAKIIGIGRQVVGKRKDGSEFPMDLSVGKLETDNGTHFIGIVRDITERVELERARDKNIHDLTKSNQALDDFAYIASHDLKEPLRGLANNAMFFAEDYGDNLDESGTKRIDRMCMLTKRMEKLIDNLLYFSRLGRQDLAIQNTNINDVIHEIITMIETLIEEEHVSIKVVKPMPSVVCDKHRISEVFRNLITNAIKYNTGDKKVIELDFHTSKDGRNNVFSVKDNGIGIAKEFHQDIFKIFKRLNIEDENARGTGVGLTFVEKIIDRHGGEIWLESEPDVGTTFYFTLAGKTS